MPRSSTTATSGEGSKNALSALGAALNVSPEAFLEYKTALYSTKWHPEETDDKFKSDDYLIKVANTVDALKNNKEFQKAVKNGTYDKLGAGDVAEVRQERRPAHRP